MVGFKIEDLAVGCKKKGNSTAWHLLVLSFILKFKMRKKIRRFHRCLHWRKRFSAAQEKLT